MLVTPEQVSIKMASGTCLVAPLHRRCIKSILWHDILMINDEHRLENLEPEPEPGEPRLEILEA